MNLPIVELEPPTKAKIRSTQILTSLPHLISELVQNSLDARASHVEIGLDPAEWECWVRDDGQGISAEGLELLGKGHNEGRYNTSKTYDNTHIGSSTFGFRGEALASAMELSCLEISSRTIRGKESRSVIIKGGEQLYLGPSVRWRRERPGTTVVARDIFYNVPVRRKSHHNAARTIDLAKKEVETLALVFPHVSFSLDHVHAGQKNRVLTIVRTTSSLAAFRALYGVALTKHVEEINLCSEDLRLEGFVSLEGSESRAFQNFYVNKHPMALGEIQRAVEKYFVSSRSAQYHDQQKSASHMRRSPRKIEKKPVYVLNLSISSLQVDNFIEPAKSMVQFQDMGRVLAFVLEAMTRVLDKNHILAEQSQSVDINTRSPRKRLRRDNSRSNTRHAHQANASQIAQNVQDRASPVPGPSTGDSSTLRLSYESPEENAPPASLDHSGYFEWTDPTSGESFLVDLSTGNSFPSNRLPNYLCEYSGSDFQENEATSFVRRSLKTGHSNAKSRGNNADRVPLWLTSAMQHDSTFPLSERVVFSSKYLASGDLGTKKTAHTPRSWGSICTSNLCQSSKAASDTLSASDLKHSRVIAQVDTKFIACLLERPERILALVDQHAADERVRVEKYLKKLCFEFLEGEAKTMRFRQPRSILLARRDIDVLATREILNVLRRWGLWLELEIPSSQMVSSTQRAEFVQVGVTAVPDVVASKLTAEQELKAFAKSMIAAIEANVFVPPPTVPIDSQDERDWVKALRYCPAPLLELVNSKACRGAIMFNDPLDQDQCEHLIHQLSETVFPFQCAHGRPSIAPLTKLPKVESESAAVDWRAFAKQDW